MKGQIAEIWDDALRRLKKAEEHLKAGESELVKHEAQGAAVSGLVAVTFLLKEEDKQTFQVALDHTFDGSFLEWEKSCSSPKDYITKARKLLKGYANLSPPENKFWGV